MKTYKHILFDLDHTLWDFHTNSLQTLEELYQEFELLQNGVPSSQQFIQEYKEVNRHYWELHRNGKVDKHIIRNHRFHDLLSRFGIYNNELALTLSDNYISRCPTKTNLMPHAKSTLAYLHDHGYRLHIITNGFHETQMTKLTSSGLIDYFDVITTSEDSGSTKPDRAIFTHFLSRANASSDSCIMVGDNLEVDIKGARNAFIDQVFLNPEGTEHNKMVTYEINCLSEIEEML
jgi:putative hydrolase of the HAD superfamily